MVAPFTGAWIEICIILHYFGCVASLPSRERGLKYERGHVLGGSYESLPSRERGLKSETAQNQVCTRSSLPSRERGLKSHVHGLAVTHESRSLHGSVD